MADLIKLGDFIQKAQLEVGCPYCFSPIGEACYGPNGTAVRTHHERNVAWMKQQAEKFGRSDQKIPPKPERRQLEIQWKGKLS